MSELRLTASTTFSETLSGLTISAAWSKIYLTALVRKGDAATDAILQLVETNPADDDDGLLYLDGSAPTAAAKVRWWSLRLPGRSGSRWRMMRQRILWCRLRVRIP